MKTRAPVPSRSVVALRDDDGTEHGAPAPPVHPSTPALTTDSGRMLKTLLSNLEGMVYRCRDDEQWTMEFVSEGSFGLTGYTPAELLLNGRISYEDITHPDDRARVRQTIKAAIAERTRFDIEYRIRRADGATRWVWERGIAIRDAHGRVEALEGIVEDITERMESELALREAERRYRSLFDNAIEGIFRTTPDGRYLDANAALARIYGFGTPQELIENLQDIRRELYVDSTRREEFMRIVKARGSILRGHRRGRYRTAPLSSAHRATGQLRHANGARQSLAAPRPNSAGDSRGR
jgi:PAS domain S-box-containing protein